MTGPTIAIVGATGLVGNEMLVVLEELKLPVGKVRLLASLDSVGEVYRFGAEELVVEELTADSLRGVDLALFATSAELSSRWVPIAIEHGAVCIDNSSFYRNDPKIPLIVPEVNAGSLGVHDRLIANPNCSAMQLVPVLKSLHEFAGLKRVVVSTYQSVSGAGKAAIDELWGQHLAILNQREVVNEVFPHQIAFNLIPQIDSVQDDGYTKEEQKIMTETRKILGLPELSITATAVRVPTLHTHAESVNVELSRPFELAELTANLAKMSGVEVWADPGEYPMPLQAVSTNPIHVGRIRRDHSVPNGVNLWIVADNLRKGAALNAVQIAELVLARRQLQ
jgi:aspartate-semialdehyde dehydrogenase